MPPFIVVFLIGRLLSLEIGIIVLLCCLLRHQRYTAPLPSSPYPAYDKSGPSCIISSLFSLSSSAVVVSVIQDRRLSSSLSLSPTFYPSGLSSLPLSPPSLTSDCTNPLCAIASFGRMLSQVVIVGQLLLHYVRLSRPRTPFQGVYPEFLSRLLASPSLLLKSTFLSPRWCWSLR